MLYLYWSMFIINDMQSQQSEIVFDIKNFQICQFCFRLIALICLEVYLVFLYVREMVKLENSNYDKLDISIFVVSIICLIVDIVSACAFGIGISEIAILMKIVWSLVLYLIFLRFIFRREKCAKYFIISVLSLMLYAFLSISFLKTIPLRYTLLLIYSAITICSFHQCFLISQLLNHQRQRQQQLKQSLYQRVIKQSQVQLLDHRKQYQHRVISSQVKYHLYLRRSFCIVMTVTLLISYFLMWNLEESRNSLGELLVISIVQLLPPMEYYFFSCANQWLIQYRSKSLQDQQNNMIQSS